MPRYQQVVRQWRLLQRLEGATDGINVADLANLEGVGQRNIYRDLEALQDAGFPVYNDNARWYLTDTFRHKGGVPLQLSEVLALRCARSALEALSETPLNDGFRDLVTKLDTLITPEMQVFAQQLDRLFVGDRFGRPEYKSSSTEQEILRAAVTQGHSVQLKYKAPSGKISDRLVDPYHFWFHRGVLYLVGKCHLRDQIRMFSMARVVELSPSDHQFDPDSEFDFDSFRRARFRTWAEGAPVMVRIQFTPEAAAYVEERRWHPSQQSAKLPDGGVELQMETSGITELTTWVLSFGPRAKVLEPPVLVEKVKEALKGALEGYEEGGRGHEEPGDTERK